MYPKTCPSETPPAPFRPLLFQIFFGKEEGIGKGADPGYEEHLKTLSHLP
jgi:hypothetical protein